MFGTISDFIRGNNHGNGKLNIKIRKMPKIFFLALVAIIEKKITKLSDPTSLIPDYIKPVNYPETPLVLIL